MGLGYSWLVEKKTCWHGLHSGLPPYMSEEADREQLRQMPKASAPCLATRIVLRSQATQAERTSENGQPD